MSRIVAMLGALACTGALLAATDANSAGTTVTRDGEKYQVDGSTADEAKKKIEAAGYRGVKQLKKGLDSVWHGSATKDGKETRIALTPDGKVYPEGD
jgi:hypothetical protein